ncbi:MAG: hypothetical protein ACREXS_11430, partial [Gammaproteobacteria bacterium]
RADPIMARADTTLNKRPDIYTQSFLTAIGVSLLANRVESIYTISTERPGPRAPKGTELT